jgi:Mn2+/Fe2+ NRAMP family transporter
MRVTVYSPSEVSTAVQTDIGKPSHSQGNTLANVAADVEIQDVEYVNLANGWIIASVGWITWFFIAGLNVYLIVMLGLGKD